MLRFVIGKAGSGKTSMVMNEIQDFMERGEGDILFIVPEQFSHECERELCSRCGDTMSRFVKVTSFKYMTLTLQQQFGGAAGEYLDNGGKLLCMALAVKNTAETLTTFADAVRSPELQNALLGAVDEMKSAAISAEQLRKSAARLDGDLAEKLKDLAQIMEAYDAVVENGHADPVNRISIMARQIEENGYGKGKRIYLDGFTGFTVAEMNVLEALMKTGAEVTICLTLDSVRSGEELFTPTRITAFELADSAQSLGVETRVITAEEQKDPPVQELVRCSSIMEECECAASRVLSLVRGEPCRYRDIAIAVRGFDDYKPVLQSVFEKYQIPLMVTERNPMMSRPLPTMISCAYDIVLGGWNSDDLISFFGTGLTPESGEERDQITKKLSARRILEREKPAYLKKFEKEIRKAGTAEEQVNALYRLMENMNLAKRFTERAEEFPEYLQMWDLVLEVLEQFSAILGDADMEAEEFARLIRLMLSKYDIGLIPTSLDSVSAGDFDRMRRRNIRHLLILGANEDRLPMMSGESGLFTQDEREALSEIGVVPGFVMQSDIWHESFLVYLCKHLPSASLTYITSANPSVEIPAGIPASSFEADEARKAYLQVLEEQSPERMHLMEQRARRRRGSLSPDSVEALYGKDIGISASRADQFYSCKYAYFCNYGLRAKKWEKDEFSAADLGDFMHYTLETAIRENLDVRQAIDRYVHEEMNDLKDRSDRYIYLFRRLETTVEAVVQDVLEELKNSDFQPQSFEQELPGSGVADRVDQWEHNGKQYLRVVDYKTGNKTFSLSDIWYGINMQMLMYLNALQKDGEQTEGAGIMYVPARKTYQYCAKRLTDAELKEKRDKERRRSGLVLGSDGVPEAWEKGERKLFTPSGTPATKKQLQMLYGHIDKKLAEMTESIRSGAIEADPTRTDSAHSACTYCAYKDACGFVDGENGECARNLTPMKEEKVWEKIGEELDHG